MTFTTRKAAALTAAAALAMSGATGVASAQSEIGSIDAGSLGAGSAEGSTESAGNGSVPENLGSIILENNATGQGSIDTSGSALFGEPSTGSLAPVAGSVLEASDSVNAINPADGTGSVDTTGSALLGEPTTGSLAPIYAPIAGSLGIGDNATLVLGSDGGSLGAGSLGPAVMIGGSAAGIGLGVYFAPQIYQALTDAGIALPPLPPLPWAPAPGGAPAPAPAPAPGPGIDNGRG